jgi:hypothetical protein
LETLLGLRPGDTVDGFKVKLGQVIVFRVPPDLAQTLAGIPQRSMVYYMMGQEGPELLPEHLQPDRWHPLMLVMDDEEPGS